MAKKFVRGITDIKTINNQDFDTNNVNDLLSDGQHNYIHRKKGNSEEYHNLTNNIKTIESSNTSLLSVTNFNNSTNSARLTPKHDRRKEQLLESTDETILIEHGENGTEETTSVDVNFEKVQEKLTTGKGLSLEQDLLNLEFSSEAVDADNIVKGNYLGLDIPHAPTTGWYWISNNFCEHEGSTYLMQIATKLSFLTSDRIKTYVRTFNNNTWTSWRELLVDKAEVNELVQTKQNTITNNTSIAVSGTGLRQLYTNKETYSHANGTLITYSKSVANSTSISTAEEEFHFLAKLDKGETSASFTLNDHDLQAFSTIINTYGLNGTVNINASAFSLNEATSTLTFTNNSGATNFNPHMTSFSDIITINQPTNNPQSVTVEKVDEIVDKTVEFDKTDENVEKEQSE